MFWCTLGPKPWIGRDPLLPSFCDERRYADDALAMIEASPCLDELIQGTADQFERQFGESARWFGAAPGRINLIGEHTDYNAGWVLPMAIDRYTVVAAASGQTPGQLTVNSQAFRTQASLKLDQLDRPHAVPWLRYVQGVVAQYQRRGIQCPELDIQVISSVPAGGGLSSSAALELAMAHLIEAVTGKPLSADQRTAACVAAERETAGVPCGVMDQTVVEHAKAGHALLLDCLHNEVTQIPFTEAGTALLAVHSGVAHALADGEYAKRREECDRVAAELGMQTLRDLTELDLQRLTGDDVLYRRARHVVSENKRVHQSVAALRAANWSQLGALMQESHASLRDDYAVSCAELDLLVDLALSEQGVYGARMTGGGFGGCIIALVDQSRVNAVAHSLCQHYAASTSRQPACYRVRPVAGAREISVLP